MNREVSTNQLQCFVALYSSGFEGDAEVKEKELYSHKKRSKKRKRDLPLDRWIGRLTGAASRKELTDCKES